MTEGYLVVLYCLVMWVCELRSLRRSRVHVYGASSQGARRGVGLRTGLAFQNFKALSMALIAYIFVEVHPGCWQDDE